MLVDINSRVTGGGRAWGNYTQYPSHDTILIVEYTSSD